MDKEEMRNFVLGLPKRLEKIEHELSTLRKNVDAIKETSDTEKISKKLIALEVAFEQESWQPQRMFRAELQRWCLNTFKEKEKSAKGEQPDGKTQDRGGRRDSPPVRLGAETPPNK